MFLVQKNILNMLAMLSMMHLVFLSVALALTVSISTQAMPEILPWFPAPLVNWFVLTV